MIRRKPTCISYFISAASLLVLAACGSPSQPANAGHFVRASITPTSTAAMASVTLSPAQLTGGASTEVTVKLTQAAPSGGIAVQLVSSNDSVVTLPATVTVPAGQTGATTAAATTTVSAVTSVAISAIYDDTVASAVLTVNPPAAAPFTVALQPVGVTRSPGQPASAKVNTTITSGYDHALQLTASNAPAGVSVTFTPSAIPAPGAGTSVASFTVPASIKPGTYSIKITATGGTTAESATLTLKVVNHDAGATFRGCWQKLNGHSYQAAAISVANPGTYPFDADLYFGTTCNPNQQADEFGFGTPLNFGGFGYIFWFTDFADQSNMSAIWHVGTDKSQCVNYEVAPSC
jgi:hypothetical protein